MRCRLCEGAAFDDGDEAAHQRQAIHTPIVLHYRTVCRWLCPSRGWWGLITSASCRTVRVRGGPHESAERSHRGGPPQHGRPLHSSPARLSSPTPTSVRCAGAIGLLFVAIRF